MLYALKDCANLQVVKASNKKPVIYCNYARTSSIEFTANSTYAYSKTTKAVRFDTEREGVFTTEMQIFDTAMLALLFGTEIKTATLPIAKREILNVQNGVATMEGTAKAGSLTVFKVDPSDKVVHIAEQTVGTPASTPNTYSISSKTLTFNATTFPDNNGYVALYYLVDSSVKTFSVDNVSFPDGYIIYADSAIKGTDQEDKFVQFQLLNVKPQSNVSLSMDAENVATLTITWDIMADGAGNMMHYAEIA